MILASGAFDGLHAGHILYLEAAKQLCLTEELLVCAVAPDAYILTEKKRTPHWSQHDRLRTVSAIGCIDAAVLQAAPSVAGLIRDYRPRIFVKGVDWKNRLPEDVMLACDETGTAIAYVETPGRHVSEAVQTVATAKREAADIAALSTFEALVLSQQPAEQPWEPVTDYSFEHRKEIEGQHPQLIKEVFQPQHLVADIGCGPGHLVRLLRELGVKASGWDKDYVGDHIKWMDITQLPRYTPIPFELVICREVLEHLTIRQIRQAVTNLCGLSSKYVYVTTRFSKNPQHLLDVDTSDDLDPTHISMLNQNFLRTLFVLEGFKRRADLEARMDWKQLGRVLVYERC